MKGKGSVMLCTMLILVGVLAFLCYQGIGEKKQGSVWNGGTTEFCVRKNGRRRHPCYAGASGGEKSNEGGKANASNWDFSFPA